MTPEEFIEIAKRLYGPERVEASVARSKAAVANKAPPRPTSRFWEACVDPIADAEALWEIRREKEAIWGDNINAERSKDKNRFR